jgi:4'-phosphopantetheinyl transferase
MLDETERTRAGRFRFAPDRCRFTAAHALARAMLSDATGLPTAVWRFEPGDFGKPAIVNSHAAPGLQFNISHTRGCVACAIAFHDAGVDVEAGDRDHDQGVAERFFAPEENALLRRVARSERSAMFFAIWTLKEAFIKATGDGLRRPLASFAFALDPPRISFHSPRLAQPSNDDPARWQFAQYFAAPHLPVAVAVRRPAQYALLLDARAALPEEIQPA